MELALNSAEEGNPTDAWELCYSAVREAEAAAGQTRRLATSPEAPGALACHRGRYLVA